MQVLKSNRYLGPTDYRASRPYQVKPEIVGTRMDAKGGVETYISRDGKEWDPKTYDRLYNVPVNLTKMKAKGYKGKNPDGRKVY
jgi:hypothetical protein